MHSSFSHNSKNWKQSKCPSTGEWLNRLCYIRVMKYMKWNLIKVINYWSIQQPQWISKKSCRMKKSQSQKVANWMIIFVEHSWNVKTIENIYSYQESEVGWESEVGMILKRQHHKESLWWWKCSVSSVYQCQYPACYVIV